MLEEPVELREESARDVEAAAQQALDVALTLADLALFRGQARTVAAEVAAAVRPETRSFGRMRPQHQLPGSR